MSLNNETFLVLSIHEIHAERIFSGEKLFELRKVLPKFPFQKVFLYQTGGKGLVGAFDVEDVLRGSPTELWDIVGEAGTTKSRFFDYFNNRQDACAIKVAQPVRFFEPVEKDYLKKHESEFTAPQSYLIIRPQTNLHKFLTSKFKKEVKKKSSLLQSKKNTSPSFAA